MKKIWPGVFLGICCMILLFCPLCANARENGETMRVGYFDYDGFWETGPDGKISGFGREYLEEISFYTGWRYEYVYGDWGQCLERLKRGEIDLLCNMQRSEEREQDFDFAQYESGIEYAALLVANDNNTIYYKDYESFDGLRIGTMRGTYQSGLLKKYARDHHFTYTETVYSTQDQLEKALGAGEIDAVLSSSLQQNSGKKAVAKFSPMPFYIATSKGNTAVLEELNSALEEIQTADVHFNSRIYSKYFGAAAVDRLAFTRDEAAYIAAHPSLRVAYNEDWNPISYRDAGSGRCDGVCAGLLELLSQRSGMRFEYLPVKTEREAVEMLRAGEADFICGFPNRYSQEARRYGVLLTKPFYEVPVTLSIPTTQLIADVKRIAVPQNSLSLQRYAQELYPRAEILLFANTDACMEAVRSGRADAVFENAYVLDQYGKDGRSYLLETAPTENHVLALCFGVNENENPVLRSLLNKLIARLSSSEVSNIVVQNTMVGPHIHWQSIVRQVFLPLLAFFLLLFLAISIRSRRQVERYAFVDPLTGRWNETKFLLSADRLLRGRGGAPYAVAALDIDKFKLINNMHSYETGNRVLCAISDLLAQEIGEDELFCRESNDHFVLLLRDTGEELEERMTALSGKITDLPRQLKEYFQYTISCGVYRFRESDHDIHQALGWANLARQSAKEHRATWVAYYDDEMRDRATQEQEIENCMRSALENGEFEVYYQPKVRLADEKTVGAEALVRWNPSGGGIYYPDQFIPVFEKNGFIIELDLFVFEEVCKRLRAWLDAGLAPCPVSVNLSRVHLARAGFYRRYFAIMERYRIEPRFLEMELTESTAFENKAQMAALTRALKEAGVSVSVDDFGSGYSSLNMLKDLRFDYLKLDKEFFNTAADTERGKDVIESVMYLAEKLHIGVIAEGVETREQVDYLKSIHCDIVQGYYFSRPLTAGAFARYFFGFSAQEEG